MIRETLMNDAPFRFAGDAEKHRKINAGSSMLSHRFEGISIS